MKRLNLNKPDRWITNRLRTEGIDEETVLQRKIYWMASLAVSCMTGILILTYHLIFPDLQILIRYGLFLELIFLQGVILPLLIRGINISIWWQFVNQTLIAIATFIAVVKMGGIPYSGGLVLVGLALVFFSLNYKKRIATIAIFIVHIVGVIGMALIHPRLAVAPEMTPAVNISLYAINIIWISAFAFGFVMNFISQRIQLEKNETDKFKELNEAKSKLYTNITHEFRTPLTVIKSMTELIREHPETWKAEGIEKIDRNASHLLYLVNQMLDLAMVEVGAMPANIISSHINTYIGYIVEMHESYATGKKIYLTFEPCTEDPIMDFEPDQLSTIISNLVHNALKYTSPGGSVVIRTEITGKKMFIIRVSDNGTGIAKERIRYIFDRFYRAENDDGSRQPGSGLGLSLVREMVKLLEGEINVESEEGIGTTFCIRFPMKRHHPYRELSQPRQGNYPGNGIPDLNLVKPGMADMDPTPGEAADGAETTRVTVDGMQANRENGVVAGGNRETGYGVEVNRYTGNDAQSKQESGEGVKHGEVVEPEEIVKVKRATGNGTERAASRRRTASGEEKVYADKYPILLIVEDNTDVTDYLSFILKKDYRVITARDGKMGFAIAREHIPDIIISDIMMPVLDGIRMLEMLKNDLLTSHIPVIMLTAKADMESKIHGLEIGADAYLDKPFNKNELLVRIKSLISLREKLRERYINVHEPLLPEDIKYKYDDAFMNKVRETMLANLHEESYGISKLCTDIGMSRTQLYRKFSSLSDQTIANYLRTLRLYKAKEMLIHNRLSVSEVAYRTGFKNISHFSKVFKSEFDVNPSEYLHI